MQFASGSHLSSSDLALKAAGLYEVEIRDIMLAFPKTSLLVNFGGGDGYYPVAMVRAGAAGRAIAYELKDEGRKAIMDNAAANGVDGRVTVRGAASAGLAAELSADGLDGALILSDIEGAEFDVFDDALVAACRRARIVIELHPFAVANGEARQRAMIARLEPSHAVRIIDAVPRDWTGVPEIEAMHDIDRALVTTEGRKLRARWLIAEPR
jgi:tRNA G37 N-methylase Trm5